MTTAFQPSAFQTAPPAFQIDLTGGEAFQCGAFQANAFQVADTCGVNEVTRSTVGGPPRVYVDEEWGAYLPKPDPYVVVEVVPTASGVSMVEKAAPEPRFMAKRATKFQHEPEFTDEDLAEARELIERARVASRNRRARALLLLS